MHAGAPDVTRLTFDRESRTLTCTSTGGPATTVIWTKDGAVITPSTTHQQTQMIVDTVGGIYQNNLTIAQSVARDNFHGLYSCMAKNSWGTSNRTQYVYGKIHKWIVIMGIASIKLQEAAASSFLLYNDEHPSWAYRFVSSYITSVDG